MSVLAWLVWVLINGVATQAGASFALIIVDDFLASVFVVGLVGTMIGLLPLRFLPGWDLQQWNRGAWFACFGVAVFAVVEVLLLPHNDNHSNTPLITTIALLLIFGGVSIGMREWFARRRWRGNAPVSLRGHLQELLTPIESAGSSGEAILERADVERPKDARPAPR